MLGHGGQVASDRAKLFGADEGAEAPGYLSPHFDHADVAFGAVVVWGTLQSEVNRRELSWRLSSRRTPSDSAIHPQAWTQARQPMPTSAQRKEHQTRPHKDHPKHQSRCHTPTRPRSEATI